MAAAALVFFAFIGFDEVITLAEKTQDPTRTVPRALLLALGLSAALYVAVAVASVRVLGADARAASPRPLADVMAHVLGDRGATVVAAIAVLTTTNTTLLALTAGSRVLYGMAKNGALPATLASVHPTRRTPIRAILVVMASAAVFAILGDFAIIGAVTDFAVYVVFLAVNGTVIVLRRTHPRVPRPFAVGGVSDPADLWTRIGGADDDAAGAARPHRRRGHVWRWWLRRMADQVAKRRPVAELIVRSLRHQPCRPVGVLRARGIENQCAVLPW